MHEWLSFGPRTEHAGALRADIRPVTDVVADVRAMPTEWSGRFNGVECYHVLEHLLPDEASVAAGELYRVLAPGGELLAAVPDLEACARGLLAGDLDIMRNIYSPSTEPEQQHRWGYTHKTFVDLLVGAGFVHERDEQPHPLDPNEMRVVMRKP